MKAYLYKVTFPNGKSYIGCTTNLGQRLFNHQHLAKYPTKQSQRVHMAIRNFKIFHLEVLSVARTVKDGHNAEKRFIKKFGTSYPNGYNVTEGGPGCNGPLVRRSVRPIRDQFGNSYPSVTQAAKAIGARTQDVWKVLKHCQNRTQIRGYQFTYLN